MKIAAAFYTVLRAYGTNEQEIPTVAYLNGREPCKELLQVSFLKMLNILRISILTILSPFFQRQVSNVKNIKLGLLRMSCVT